MTGEQDAGGTLDIGKSFSRLALVFVFLIERPIHTWLKLRVPSTTNTSSHRYLN
jgi:hypothetical protein